MGEPKEASWATVYTILEQTRGIRLNDEMKLGPSVGVIPKLQILSRRLLDSGHPRESRALMDVLDVCSQPRDLGGLGLGAISRATVQEESEILFLVSAWLEALNSADRSRSMPPPLPSRPRGRRGMTLSEKIFAMHAIYGNGCVAPGDLVRVGVDWVLASEASWAGMEITYNQLGSPGIYRNDRFWLAGDHVVDPRINDRPQIQALIDASERAKRVFKMTDYQGMNYTILHTEFFRERAQPGMLIIGSDSHTCSSGALGCLAIGLGAADVTLPLVTGETWFRIPESVNIRLAGKPRLGIGGKDVILYILQQLKRNTSASDRIVEFTGPGLQHLSADARFAMCNMTAELGGITGVFVPDHITHEFMAKRRLRRHKSSSNYFRPDDDAEYAASYDIDLGCVESSFARYPRPDDVVPVADHIGMQVDGCFIGACTTTEEDLILAGLVLEQGLKKGLQPHKEGKRKMVPGSLPVLRRLRELGLADVYEAAGFEVGIPGCSYCVGMSADHAAPGEVWLTSQNRNFENRMGKGSIGHLGSAATVAASSFSMRLTDPLELLSGIDMTHWNIIRGTAESPVRTSASFLTYVEPTPSLDTITGKVQRLGDFIDTDALAPAEFLIGMKTNQQSALHCLQYMHPEFRRRVKDGFNIVVAGKAFGCGSSREQAVMALVGCGVQCVIAKSFAFIFHRNMPNIGLLGITISDEIFYEMVRDGTNLTIDFETQVVDVEGSKFEFQLSQMEREMYRHGGITSAFRTFGKTLFKELTAANDVRREPNEQSCDRASALQW